MPSDGWDHRQARGPNHGWYYPVGGGESGWITQHPTKPDIFYAGSQGALRTWWSGAMDRTTTPSFDMKLRRGDADAVSVEIPVSGEVFELEEHLRQAYAGFDQGRSVMSPQQARPSIVVALAVDRALREGRTIDLA